MIKNISFESLKVLIAVAESKNFYQAAEKLKVTQPSVSQKLKELESQLPLELFQLEGKRKVLTHYGRSLYEVAKTQSNSLEKEIENMHRHYMSAEYLTLRVGGRSEILDYVSHFLNFEGKTEFVSLTSSEAVEQLLDHAIDIAISYNLPDSTEIIAKKLFQSTSYFIIHQDLLKSKKLNQSLLKDKDFLRETPCILYKNEAPIILELIKEADLQLSQLNVRYVSEDWRTIQSLVSQGKGFAIVPQYIRNNHGSVRRIELMDTAFKKFTFYALYEKGLKKIEPFKKVLEFKSTAKE